RHGRGQAGADPGAAQPLQMPADRGRPARREPLRLGLSGGGRSMKTHAVPRREFWLRSPGFWPESANSAPRANSGFWLFRFVFSGLEGAFQNPEGPFRILLRSLEVPFRIKVLEQIPEFGKVPPKGVGDLTAKRGRVTTYPR